MSKRKRKPSPLAPQFARAAAAGMLRKPFPGLVWKQGEFAFSRTHLLLPGMDPLPIEPEWPPLEKVTQLILNTDGDDFTVQFEWIEEESEEQ